MKRLLASLALAILALLSLGMVAAPVLGSASSEACSAVGDGFTYSVDKDGVGHCTSPSAKELTGNAGLIKAGTNALIFVAGAIAVVVIIIGGIGYIASTGDPSRIMKAKNTILYAVVGLLVAILAYAIVNYVVGAVS